jgi:plasmid stabilization system protein ParE
VDLEQLHAYLIATAGEDIADGLADEVAAKLQWIANSGTAGVSRDKLSPGLRSSRHKRQIIYFRVIGDECRIVRVIHSSRDLARQKFEA